MTLNSAQSLLYTTGVSFLSKWDVQTGARLASAHVYERVTRVVLSKDESSLFLGASEDDGALLRYSAATLERLERIPAHSSFVKALVLLPRHDLLVSGSADKRIMVWDAQKTARLKTLTNHEDWVWAFAHTKAEDAFFSGSSDRSVIEYSVPDFAVVGKVSLPEWVMSLTFAPDEQTLFAGGQSSVFLINRKLRAVVSSFKVHDGSIWNIIVDAPRNALITSSNDKTVAITSLDSPTVQFHYAHHTDQIYALQQVGDQLVSASCDKRISFFSSKQGYEFIEARLRKKGLLPGSRSISPVNKSDTETVGSPPSEQATSTSEVAESKTETMESGKKSEEPAAREEEIEEFIEIKKLFFGNDWVFGCVRLGKLIPKNQINADQPFSFKGVEHNILEFTPEGQLVSESGDIFELNYADKTIVKKGKVDLF